MFLTEGNEANEELFTLLPLFSSVQIHFCRKEAQDAQNLFLPRIARILRICRKPPRRSVERNRPQSKRERANPPALRTRDLTRASGGIRRRERLSVSSYSSFYSCKFVILVVVCYLLAPNSRSMAWAMFSRHGADMLTGRFMSRTPRMNAESSA